MKQHLQMSGCHLPAENKSSGRSIAKLCLSLLLMLVSISASAQLKGTGTEDDPYLIGSVDDWYALADSLRYEKTVNVKMTADIGPLTSPDYFYCIVYFSGVFDGQGHTLTVDGYYPPFWGIYPGTAIKNLHIAGTITTDGTMVGGIANETLVNHNNPSDLRPCNFYNCRSSVIITLAYEGRQRSERIGGLIGEANIPINFEDCLFDGAIKQEAPTPQDRAKAIGGFVGFVYSNWPISIKNSFIAGKIQNASSQYYDAPASASFVYPSYNSVTVENSYWIEDYVDELKDSFFIPQGTAIKSDDARLKSGEIANLLQGEQTDTLYWGQAIGTDPTPTLTADDAKHVFRVDFSDAADNKVISRYANKGMTVSLPTSKEFITSNDKYNYYRLSFGNGFTADTKVEGDMTVPVTYESVNDFNIATVADWNEFAQAVADGHNYLNASIADNIDGVTTMVGTKEYPYAGRVFNYNDYVVTVNYDFSNTDTLVIAPFRYANGAVLHHFHSAGTIKTNSNAGNTIGGILGEAVGESTIESSMSTVDITRTGEGEAYTGGIVGHLSRGGKVTLNNVGFAGNFKGENGNIYGGLIGWMDNGTAEINNSYTAGNIDVPAPAEGEAGSTPFVGCNNSDQYTLENCYYLPFTNMQATDRGTAVTDGQLRSGEVTFNLQRQQGETSWCQLIGVDSIPQIYDGRSGRNVSETVYDDSTKAYDNYLVLDENKSILKSLEDNLSYGSGLKLKRTFTEGWNTLILPCYLSTEDVNEAFGEDTKVAYFTNDRPNYIALNTKEDTKEIMAFEPVLIKPSKPISELTTVVIPYGYFDSPYNGVQISGDNGINFIGSFDANYTMQDGEYFINGMKLWKSDGNATIKGTRAYFTVPEEAAEAKIGLIIDGEDVTTGISGVTIDGVEYGGNSAVYTLAGQKIANSLSEARNLKAGVYITNGKKVVIK